MSFSAHADAKGIMQLIRMAEPRNMLLVHGEAVKMEFLKGKIEQEFSKSRQDEQLRPARITHHISVIRLFKSKRYMYVSSQREEML